MWGRKNEKITEYEWRICLNMPQVNSPNLPSNVLSCFVWDLSFSRLFVHQVYSQPCFVVSPTRGALVCVCVCLYIRMGVCVCVSHRRGLSSRFPQNLSLALWFKAGQLMQGRTEGEKECKEEEWLTEGEEKLGGCQILLKVFAQCLKSEDEDLEGSRIIQSQYPSTIRAFGLLQRNNVVRLTVAAFFSVI